MAFQQLFRNSSRLYNDFHQISRLKAMSPNFTKCSLPQRCVGTSGPTSHSQSQNCDWVAKLQRILRGPSLSESLQAICRLLARQCNVYAGQRIWRLQQMWFFYSSLYPETALQKIVVNFARRNLRTNKKPLYYLFGAACFTWDRDRITDNDLKRFVAADEALLAQLYTSSTYQRTVELPSWEQIIDRQHLKVWRKPRDSSYLYEYKVYAKFFDISARSFLKVNMDLEYRKVWDKLVIQLDLIDRDEETGSEVVHWISYFPFPMQSRDYVYLRRCKIDHRTKTMYLVSKATEHPSLPPNKNHVRVTRFESTLIIRPHRTFDEDGFDYIMTYHDDPKAPIPTAAVTWMTKEGFPGFVQTMHDAAKHLDNTMEDDIISGSSKDSQQFMPSLST